jgi:hypothetical protein
LHTPLITHKYDSRSKFHKKSLCVCVCVCVYARQHMYAFHITQSGIKPIEMQTVHTLSDSSLSLSLTHAHITHTHWCCVSSGRCLVSQQKYNSVAKKCFHNQLRTSIICGQKFVFQKIFFNLKEKVKLNVFLTILNIWLNLVSTDLTDLYNKK